ncbi:GTP diphosphokinase [Simiduia aestuariiviva]|uniref:GTP pyrophosphokinase n=1 Tax=Simiduia aestuariiviva TaxID=1510459 RepID=A0A839USB7_9GAMM|nr:GTP diphosphokinase [Simiduia aestuariiviva]MBB3168275.1 GTP pyrophosphokinase [Simiduia aestuariiviva]
MVKVREDQPIKSDGQVDVEAWLSRLDAKVQLTSESYSRIKLACLAAVEAEQDAIASENIWVTGISSSKTGLEMADILADLNLDVDTLVSAILYRAVREGKLSKKFVGKEFGANIEKLIDGVLRMAAISGVRLSDENVALGRHSEEHAENVRRMLVAMVDDVRVALIKLAERTCAIRALKNATAERRQRVAREIANVYAPLAHRLGIGHIKWELEDLAFRYLEPDDYKTIARLLDEKRLGRQQYIDNVISTLRGELTGAAIEGEITGRAKHIYSIWRKMRRKNIGFSQVYDIRAVRILVPTVRDCYAVLGIVHSLWRNIPNEFDDYIASPKENGYRSLHTAVIGPERKVLEIQIRTFSMHEDAEFGVCAHWRYKGTDKEEEQTGYDQKIAWLRQVLEWHEELGDKSGDSNPLADDLNLGLNQDRIYVFTPDGHVIDLPSGATPLDFAYRIHTDVGNKCCGAKVNGRIVPLNHALATSDQVEILTGKRESPSRDWLSPALGYVTTSRARAKIQQWFKLQAREKNLADGRALLDKEFKRIAVQDIDFEELAKSLHSKSLDDLYAAVGASDISVTQVLNAAQRLLETDAADDSKLPQLKVARATGDSADVYIDGVGNLLTHLAKCCSPVPGDAITGYITLGKGVSIHRQDCSNILQLESDEPERIIQVAWGVAPQKYYAVEVLIEAFDRQGLLRDVTALLDSEKINIVAMQTLSNKNLNTVDMQVTIEVKNFNALSRALNRLNQLPNVAAARRMR